MQQAIVALLVGGCSVYAAWVLMPAAWRRMLARLPLPRALAHRLQRSAAGGCGGCGGCAEPAARPVTIHRR